MPAPSPITTDKLPYLIIGQGLAGSTLAWQLHEQGKSVVVIDAAEVTTSSRIAAGLLTPITGKRFMLSHRWDELWPIARDFYRKIEKQTNAQLLTELPAWRLFLDEEERTRFHARQSEPHYAARTRPLSMIEQVASLASSCFDPEDSGFVLLESARLDTNAYLNTTRTWLLEQQAYQELRLDADNDLEMSAEGVFCKPLDRYFAGVIFCQGYTSQPSRWMSDLKLEPAAGEILTVELPGLNVDRVLHCGVWLVPVHDEANTYRLGATHRWKEIDSGISEVGRNELLNRLAKFWHGEVKIVDQQVAIRPTTSDRLPNFGIRAEESRVAWLNGLGAKGSLWAPWCAQELCFDLFRSTES